MLMLPLVGLRVKEAVRHGICVPTQYLLWDRAELQKALIDLVGHSIFRKQTHV
jgi:hypothetical protein